ncbi:ATP-binding protein [Aurantivibrio infirmus]
MDSKALTDLEVAFGVAPSPELAKIIVLAHADNGSLADKLVFLESLSLPLGDMDLLKIITSLLEIDERDAAKKLIDQGNIDQEILLVDILLAENQDQQAREIYRRIVKEKPSLKRADLENFFSGEAIDSKPKLRVVEKIDFSEVVELTRYKQPTTTFSDVVGLDIIKKQISKKIILPFQKPSLFQKFKKKVGGGVVLFGPPGCGKTLLARATAGECKASFYNIEIADVLDMYIGESEQKLRAIFEKARAETPSVLFFDELEALAGKREHTRNSSISNTISQFLTELDGFSQNNEGVLVLASTNVPWSIDPAFLRPGRFDRMFFVPPPDQRARQSILVHHMKGRPCEDNIDFKMLASKTSGYSGADLANLVEMAADEAIDESIENEQEVLIGMRHFKQSVQDSQATTSEWLTTARNYARYANDGGRYNDVIEFLKKHGK